MNAGEVCGRAGCPGVYEDMGGGVLYCDTCGLAPGGGSGTAAAPESSESSGSSGSSRASVPGQLSRSRGTGSGRSGRSVSVRNSVRSTGSGPGSSEATAPSVPSGRGRLGAGLFSVPEVPRPDPRAAVMAHAEVPERKRFCSRAECGAPVGRSRGDRPGRTEGFCTSCGHPYSLVPKLAAGDVVHGQYEVVGCLAHGGLGWIYLAVDHAVSERWVVLKGLLDTGDQDAMAAAIAERRFLAEIEHATIVRIYNFVEHLDQRTGSLDGYIVMEYVGGKSLKELANDRRDASGRRDPMPVEQACAYGIEALDALGHLHSRSLIYCDFKIDNAIQQGDQLKLIDLGAVRRMDDPDSAIYGTVGYQAPEVGETGPTVASDLYTVARTLAVLTLDFQGYTTVFADSLPSPEHVEVFRTYESFYRLLVRATDPDPERRFASAQEMAEQLTGVLREVVALRTGRPRPALSTLFGPEVRVTGTELFTPAAEEEVSRLGVRPTGPRGRGEPMVAPRVGLLAPLDVPAAALALPVPRVDPGDPHAGHLAGPMPASPAELIAALRAVPDPSAGIRLREVRALLEAGEPEEAAAVLDRSTAPDGGEGTGDVPADAWRTVWYRGLTALAAGDHGTAADCFDAVYDALPGEPAPKLALALCAEVLGRTESAAEFYRLVWTSDLSYVGAAFGLARVRLTAGDRAGAVAALESVPELSVHCTAARVAAVRARLRRRPADAPLLDDLVASADQVAELTAAGLDPVRREWLTTEVLGTALDWVLSGSPGARPSVPAPPSAPGSGDPSAGPVSLLGCALDERGLRFGLERSFRALARLAQHGEERIDLVERANRYRPRTWV
ncbi:tetratricopeptide repeat protein [Streptomyces sp. NPDC000594]|uniref:serine/threonine-protein kinase n=1 Tax=Streptomyces sp. NPDC000594 TaxID=3154261 RepID=UPI003321A4F6